MARDHANLFVLEGVLIALILLGAAYVVQSAQDSSYERARPRTELERVSHDVLVVLNGLTDGNGTTLLDRYLMEAYHCAFDAVPSTTDCDARRSRNLSMKVENYLPLGAGYALTLGNGIATREIYRSPLPSGEAVSASYTYAPEWNTTFLFTEFSCYEPASNVNLTLIPIDRGALAWTKYGNVTIGAAETSGVRAHTPGWWNVSLPAATRPASATVVANTTGNASFPGATTYGACDVMGLGATLRTALADARVTASRTVVPLAGSTTFTAELAPIASIPGVTITRANVTVYEPMPPRNATPNTWIVAGVVPLAGSETRTGTWTAPDTTAYGAHPALLRVNLTTGSTQLELRKAIVVQVALPTGEVPIDPSYRVSLQTWLPDWS